MAKKQNKPESVFILIVKDKTGNIIEKRHINLKEWQILYYNRVINKTDNNIYLLYQKYTIKKKEQIDSFFNFYAAFKQKPVGKFINNIFIYYAVVAKVS
jgi:hypothetical protein